METQHTSPQPASEETAPNPVPVVIDDLDAPGPDDCFPDFSEINSEKTPNSYDPSEVPAPSEVSPPSEVNQRKQTFLVAYQLGLTVEQAAHFAGVTPRAAYYWRDKDHDFAQSWRNSRDRFVEALEMCAFQRAAKGSDRMLTFLLKSHRPDIYNERVRASNANSRSQDHRCVNFSELAERLRRQEEKEKREQVSPPPSHEVMPPQETCD